MQIGGVGSTWLPQEGNLKDDFQISTQTRPNKNPSKKAFSLYKMYCTPFFTRKASMEFLNTFFPVGLMEIDHKRLFWGFGQDQAATVVWWWLRQHFQTPSLCQWHCCWRLLHIPCSLRVRLMAWFRFFLEGGFKPKQAWFSVICHDFLWFATIFLWFAMIFCDVLQSSAIFYKFLWFAKRSSTVFRNTGLTTA